MPGKSSDSGEATPIRPEIAKLIRKKERSSSSPKNKIKTTNRKKKENSSSESRVKTTNKKKKDARSKATSSPKAKRSASKSRKDKSIIIHATAFKEIKRLSFKQAMAEVSPKFTKCKIKHPKGFDLTVIDESPLFGSSKQRALIGLIPTIYQKELVYAAPSSGYAQIAIAYCCLLTGKKAKLFVDARKGDDVPLTHIASLLKADIVYFDPKVKEKRLPYAQEEAKQYCAKNKGSYLLPFGLNDDTIKDLYYNSFVPLQKKYNPTRLWITCGSGTILSVLSRVWPDTEMMIVQVGKTLWPDMLEGIKHQLFISPYKFHEDVKEEPPYNTILNYDGKVWPFVLEHGKEGDFIWNTASSPLSEAAVKAEVARIDKLLAVAAEEEAEVIRKAKKFPYFYKEMPTANQMFENLQDEIKNTNLVETKLHKGKLTLVRNFTTDYLTIDGISNHFTEKERMNCIVNKGEKVSPQKYWEKYKDRIAREAYWLGTSDKPAWRDAMTNLRYGECNTFNPLLMIAVIKKYFTKRIKILDPSMGWGDRLIASLAMDCEMYVGFDPNKCLKEDYNTIKATLSPKTNTKFIMKKFSNSLLPINTEGDFDLVLTSPPFFNKEIYTCTEEDVNTSYKDWLKSMYKPFLQDMAKAVKPEGIVAVYIDNLVGVAPLGDDTNSVLKESGLQYLETIFLQNNSTEINGLIKIGYPRSMFIYTKTTTLINNASDSEE